MVRGAREVWRGLREGRKLRGRLKGCVELVKGGEVRDCR